MSKDREAFKVVAESRTQNAIRYIESLGKLPCLFSDQITEEDTKAIFKALKSAIREAKKDFEEGGVRHQPFRLASPDVERHVTCDRKLNWSDRKLITNKRNQNRLTTE